ncbi:MAG: serine/threonine protein kinase, partial [Endomicrobia bacterium]|nr:serine/threonine protein kinase [Endomicrobiia bacterium]
MKVKCFNCNEEVPQGNYCDQCGISLREEKTYYVFSDTTKQTSVVETKLKELETPVLKNNLIPAKYTLIRELGRGGMGVVYEAIDKTLNRKVAIKCLKEELTMRQKIKENFINHCKLVAQLDQHPNIVRIFEFFEQDNKVYVVLEFVEGKSLDKLIDEKGYLTLKEAIEIIIPVAEALSFAHRNKIIHRDLKPSNIIITSDGKIKVLDFDIARELKDSLTRLTGVADTSGTFPYMAPEQERGIYSPQADIFSLGVIFYEMLTGELPFKGPNFYLQKVMSEYKKLTEIFPEIDPQIDKIIAKCFSVEPKDRYNSVEELKYDIEKL